MNWDDSTHHSGHQVHPPHQVLEARVVAEGGELWFYCDLKTYTLSSALFNHSTELKEFSLFSKPYG